MANKKMSTNQKKKMTKREKQKRNLIVLGIEVACLILLLVILYFWGIISKMDFNPFDWDQAGINDLDDDTLNTLDGYTNIALFGLDNRTTGDYDSGRSDVIMVASINNETKEVKLLSVYRDTYLRVAEDKYRKANNAYAIGGVEGAVQLLNTNFDLNITEYACVDWAAMIEAIDALGGIEIEVNSAEVPQINKCIKEMNAVLGTNSPYLENEGRLLLDGVQATGYARVRKTKGDDFKRSSRQRIVLEAMLNKAKKADVGTLIEICNVVFDDISTSLTLTEILGLVKGVQDYEIVSTSGFPFAMTTKVVEGSGDSVIPIGLSDNVSKLHEYLFGTEGYVPSSTVQSISNTIISKTGVTASDKPINVDGFNDTAGQEGTIFKDTNE